MKLLLCQYERIWRGKNPTWKGYFRKKFQKFSTPLQAMDRAHRIGQKKTVNVYRLITKDTVEEKIMSLQRFKLNIANTVVSADNSSMNTMSTGQILDLFSLQRYDQGPSRRGRFHGTRMNLELTFILVKRKKNQRNQKVVVLVLIW